MNDFLRSIAPTVASALLGPLGGAAVAAIGEIIGIDKATQKDIGDAISGGSLTPEQVGKLRELELKYQADEKERGFRYADLEFRDKADARATAKDGGMLGWLFGLSVLLIILTIGTEIAVLRWGYPESLPDVVVGRILGLLDAIAMMVLSFWYGTSHSSAIKNGLITKVAEGR